MPPVSDVLTLEVHPWREALYEELLVMEERNATGSRLEIPAFEQNVPVKSEVAMPINSMVAKPLIGPVPNCQSTTPAMAVVS